MCAPACRQRERVEVPAHRQGGGAPADMSIRKNAEGHEMLGCPEVPSEWSMMMQGTPRVPKGSSSSNHPTLARGSPPSGV